MRVPWQCQGAAGASVRRGQGCPVLDMAGSSQLHRPHHRAHLGPAATLGAPWGNYLIKGEKERRRKQKEEETAEGMVWSEDEEVLQVLEQIASPCGPHAQQGGQGQPTTT